MSCSNVLSPLDRQASGPERRVSAVWRGGSGGRRRSRDKPCQGGKTVVAMVVVEVVVIVVAIIVVDVVVVEVVVGLDVAEPALEVVVVVEVVGLSVGVSVVLEVVMVGNGRVSTLIDLFVPTGFSFTGTPRDACESSRRRKIWDILSEQWSEEY